MIISKINNLASEPKDFELDDYIAYVKTGVTQDAIFKIRNAKTKDEKTKLKRGLPAVILGGTFEGTRGKSDLVEKTGLIGLDIDNLNTEEFALIRKTVEKDSYTQICNVSAGGHGYFVAVKYRKSNDFTETFNALEKYYLEEYGIVLDTSCKDVNRLRFISYDPEIYHNPKSKVWSKVFKEENVKKHERIIFVKSDFDEIIREVQLKGIDLSDDDYSKYRALGFAIAGTFGENGRDYFHIICQGGGKYKQKDADKHYTNFIKSNGHGITLATFYHFCKEKGISTYSEQTKTIIKQASRVKRQGGDIKTVTEHLQEFEEIEQDVSLGIVEQVFNSNFNFEKSIKDSEDKNDTQILLEYMQDAYTLKKNLITRRIESKNKSLLDADINSMYIETKIALGDTNVFRGDFDSIVFSNFTNTYNPIEEFIKEHRETKIDRDLIRDLSNTIVARTKEEQELNYLFIKKWYVGMLGTALKRGVSPLTLVLCGSVHGTGKTEWFRRLLPRDLNCLYAESKLDGGADDFIMMTQKILIMDDEFGGKSKKDEQRFKEITSKATFTLRVPYGRINEDLERLATLCGTTNETGVLNDPTGNRRLLPIAITTIKHDDYNSIDKDLLFVQAFKLLESGFNYNLTKEDISLLNSSTGEFEQVDSLEELFQQYFSDDATYGYVEYLTNTEILVRLQNLSNSKIGTSKRLGQIMKKLGFEQKVKKIDGTAKRIYRVVSISKKYPDVFPPVVAPF